MSDRPLAQLLVSELRLQQEVKRLRRALTLIIRYPNNRDGDCDQDILRMQRIAAEALDPNHD